MNGPHTTFVCWRHHNNVKLQLLLFSVFLCGQSQLSDHVMHTSTIQNYTTSNIRLNTNIFTAEKKENKLIVDYKSKDNDVFGVRSAHISKTFVVAVYESCFWQFHRHAGAHAQAFAYIYAIANAKLFWRANEGKNTCSIHHDVLTKLFHSSANVFHLVWLFVSWHQLCECVYYTRNVLV